MIDVATRAASGVTHFFVGPLPRYGRLHERLVLLGLQLNWQFPFRCSLPLAIVGKIEIAVELYQPNGDRMCLKVVVAQPFFHEQNSISPCQRPDKCTCLRALSNRQVANTVVHRLNDQDFLHWRALLAVLCEEGEYSLLVI